MVARNKSFFSFSVLFALLDEIAANESVHYLGQQQARLTEYLAC
jgi:hypothetical protein